MTGAVVPVAAIEALASDLRKSAKGIRQATGDHQDGREYEAAADRLDALVAEHQTEPTPERLTDEERAEFASNLRWHFARHAAEPEKGYDSLGIENAVLCIEAIVASRTEPLRAEIIREQMERADALIELDQARAEVELLGGPRVIDTPPVDGQLGGRLGPVRCRAVRVGVGAGLGALAGDGLSGVRAVADRIEEVLGDARMPQILTPAQIAAIAAALSEAGIGDMAQVWDEGRIHGHVDRGGYDLGDGCGPDPHDCTCANPYRKGGDADG